jgi:hypothetical protein
LRLHTNMLTKCDVADHLPVRHSKRFPCCHRR